MAGAADRIATPEGRHWGRGRELDNR